MAAKEWQAGEVLISETTNQGKEWQAGPVFFSETDAPVAAGVLPQRSYPRGINQGIMRGVA